MNFLKTIKESLTLDLRSLALYRVMLGLLVIADILYRWVDLENFYTDAGLIPRSLFITELASSWSYSFLLANGNLGFVQGFMIVNIILGVMLAIGFKTRAAAMGIFICAISIHNRNWLVQNGGDDVLRVLLFFAMFLPLNKRFSIDSAMTTNKEPDSGFFSIWSISFFFQAFAIYFFSFVLKDHPIWRSDFTATYFALRLEIFATEFAKVLLNFPTALKVMTAGTIYLEAGGPVLFLAAGIFKSWWWKIRVGIIAAFWGLHLGIILTLQIGLFPYFCLAMWLAFLPAPWWDYVFSKWKSKKLDKLIIYYDEECNFCKKSIAIFKEFFLLPGVRVLAAQSDNKSYNEMKKYNSWIVVNAKGSRFFRFDALTETFRHSPVMTIMVPILQLRIVNKLGDKGYQSVAKRRKIMSGISQYLNFTPEPLTPKVLSYTYEAVGLIFFTTIFYWNMFSIHLTPAPVQPIRSLAQWSHVFQAWGMFSSHPKRDNIWVEIPATLSDGQQMELLSGSFDIKSSKSDIFPSLVPNEHWRKFYLLLSDGRTDYARYYSGYLCREWNSRNKAKIPGTTLRKLEIKVFSQENLLDGTKGPINSKLTWRHWCFDSDYKKDNP